jgi:hypothetical protein
MEEKQKGLIVELAEEDSIETKAFLLRLRKDNVFGWEVYLEGGGVVPEALQGVYTKKALGLKAIDEYMRVRKFKEENKRPYHRSRSSGKKN